jgi:hypothetical protein
VDQRLCPAANVVDVGRKETNEAGGILSRVQAGRSGRGPQRILRGERMNARFHSSRWGRIGILLILWTCTVLGVHAQLGTTATLSGTVTDPSGSVISQAVITLTSADVGITRTYTTSANGFYTLTQLAPATYQLQVQATGFSAYLQQGISLDAGASATQDVKLSMGGVNQKVVVTSEAPLINTTNANIGAEVDGKQIVELPLNQRNVYGLITLNSSVNNSSETQALGGGSSTDNADQDITFLNFSGGFFGTSAYMLDGTWDTAANSWGGVMYVPSVDATQEFKIETNTFTSQYGWSTGNVVDVTTKSGTSQYHGDAYEFYRNSALDANLWFSNHSGLPKQDLTRNQAGISQGGPLQIPGLYKQRDKTFFFGLYEHFGVSTPLVGIFTVPDTNFRKGIFSELLGAQVGTDALGRPIYSGQIYDPRSARPITAGAVDTKTGLVANSTGYIRDPIQGNNVASFLNNNFDRVGAKLISYYPSPTIDSPAANNLTVSASSPASSDEYTMRVDHNIGQASRFYARYSYKSEWKTGNPTFYGTDNPAGPGEVVGDSRWDLVAGYSHVFNQSFTMNVHAGVQNWHEHNGFQSLGFQPSSLGFPAYLDNNPQFPLINFKNTSMLGNQGDALYVHGPYVTAAVDFTRLSGAHTMSFGFMGVNMQAGQKALYSTTLNIDGGFTCGPDPYLCTANTGNDVAQALLGLPDSGSTGITSNASATGAIHYYGWYFQDDWRPTQKLTLNLGIRYEIQGAPTVHQNAGSSFDPNAINPIGERIGASGTLRGALRFLSPGNRGVYDTSYGNVAPRIGLNYRALPQLVLRAGYGIFYPPSAPGLYANPNGFGATTDIVPSLNAGANPTPGLSLENPWPSGYVKPTGNSLGALQDVGYSTGAIFRNHKSGYVQSYLLGFQYGISSNDSIEVDYFGNHGIRMLNDGLNRSQLNPKYLPLGANALNSMVANPFYGHIAPGQSGCGMDQNTIVYSHMLQPYTQYCSVNESVAPVGFSLYNAAGVTYNHRFHNGLSVLVSYTYSKFLDNVEGTNSWALNGSNSAANSYNLAAEKSVDASDIPHSLVTSYIYDLPIGRGKAIGSHFNRKTDAVLGGWEVSGIVTNKSGTPIAVNGNNWNSYGGNPRPDVIGDLHASHRGINEWFNTAAFAYAGYGNFGTAPRFFSRLRSQNYNNVDLAIMKNWLFHDSMRIQFRAEMFNAFNHPVFFAPNGSYSGCDPNASSTCQSGFGAITGTYPQREIQLSGKFYW